MKNQVEIDLGPTVAAVLAEAIPSLPGFKLRTGGSQPLLRAGSQRWRLVVQPAPDDPKQPERIASAILSDARLAGDKVLPLLTGTNLPVRLRQSLERHEISYVDAQGIAHIVAPGVLIHIERTTRRHSVTAAKGVGATSVRALQVLLEHPPREWTIVDLSREADVSVGQVHKLWILLEREGLATASGSGPEKQRTIRDRALLLDWLSRQPATRRIREQVQCAVYANTFPRLCARVTESLDRSRVPHAWTAAAAAALQQVGPTSVPRAVLRVAPDHPLSDVIDIIGAQPTDRGANLLIWTDVGSVGTHHTHRGAPLAPDLPLAPPPRVYLDLLNERRGEDLAQRYRETVLGY